MGNSRKRNSWKKEVRPEDVFMNDPKETDIIVPIMGPTGSGKSTFINTLIGQDVTPVGHDLRSHTAHIEYFAFLHPDFPNRRIVVIDTPGFDDTTVDDREILRRIAIWLTRSYDAKMKLAGVIYLHDITQDRIGGTARKNLDMLNKLCGIEATKNVILATTKWSKVTQEVGEQREKELKTEHWKYMLSLGSSIKRFDGTQRSARRLVNSVLAKNVLDAVQIQRELGDIDNILAETEAGRTLRYTVKELLEIQKNAAAQLRQEGRGPEMHQRITESEAKIQSSLNQIKALNIPPARKIKRFLRLLPQSAIPPLSLVASNEDS
ncbi:P-loop containing nucleoside triphosphate hydrolase protein [Lyophyllum atratum]|nr:P-loop containing nucleoside triphosphate hydrolase protein [Lyophyllum atratum]